MKFYDQIADFYDQWIPWKERLHLQMPFYEQLFTEMRASKIVDAGCGTGRLAVDLATRGYEVTAIDSSAKMLERTVRNADAREVELTTIQSDLLKPIDRLPSQIDVLLCVGGTLVHFFGRAALLGFLRQARSMLRTGGGLVLHFPNLPSLKAHGAKYQPLCSAKQEDGREILFVSGYEYGNSRFNLDLLVLSQEKKGWNQKLFHTAQFPWTAEDVLETIAEAGFEEPLSYGDFDYQEFNPDRHKELIVVAEAPGNAI